MITAIIQARMSSSRLAGKVMMTISGKPMLYYVYKRAIQAKTVDKTVVATSTESSDNKVASFCLDNRIDCFRGSLNNVLDRYYQCAVSFKADTIVRLTADCPLYDPKLIDQGVDVFTHTPYDYLTNHSSLTNVRGFEYEIMNIKTLKRANDDATTQYEREHVTPYIYESHPKLFKIKRLEFTNIKTPYTLTVDTSKDFIRVKTLIEKYQADKKSWLEIIHLLKSHPELV